jgi:hypothetical protein
MQAKQRRCDKSLQSLSGQLQKIALFSFKINKKIMATFELNGGQDDFGALQQHLYFKNSIQLFAGTSVSK